MPSVNFFEFFLFVHFKQGTATALKKRNEPKQNKYIYVRWSATQDKGIKNYCLKKTSLGFRGKRIKR